MEPQVFTFADALQDLEEFAREADISAAERSVRGAIRRAYREITAADDWTCLRSNGRILLEAAVTDGTVDYVHTGGAYERQLTLTGDVWPADVEDWSVQITTDEGWVICDVESRKSDTVITLDSVMNPRRDVADASYACFPRYYRLPADFGSIEQPLDESFGCLGEYVTPQHMLELSRENVTAANVQYYTIAAVPDLYGAMGIFLDSYFTEHKVVDFIYKRKPRELRYAGKDPAESPGTISVVAGSVTATGTITVFAPGHVGALLRIGSSASKIPTGLDGLSPYVEQRVIAAWGSVLSVNLDAGPAASATGVKYAITDPLDVDSVVYDAMLALAKKYLAAEKNAKNWRQLSDLAAESLFRAKCADNRVTQRRWAVPRRTPGTRLAQTPRSWRTEIP